MSHIADRVFIEEDGITVTSTHIRATGQQYPGWVIPLASVASVYEFGLGPGVVARKAVQAWTLGLYGLALFALLAQGHSDLSLALLGAATVIFLGSRPASPLWRALNSRRRIIEVRDASGEVHALKASTFDTGMRVYDAIRHAIAEQRSPG